MTAFILLCATMAAATLLWLIVPLLRAPTTAEQSSRRGERWSAAALALSLPLLAATMYMWLSNWDWQAAEEEAARSARLNDLLEQLEARLQAHPDDLDGWLLLGRSYTSMERFPQAIVAFQHAYDLSHGENVDAILGLGEAMALADQSTLTGRAGELFEQALARAPHHPKALWYASMAALSAGELRKGRDHLEELLALGPPPDLRALLERQIQDLNQQLGETGSAASPSADDASRARSIRVAVSIAPDIQRRISGPLDLFVLARDPAGGPPLAVQRHSSTQLPLTVELSTRDAMMPTRTIADAQRVQVIARLSRSGTAQAQSGDFFGQADYEFGNGPDTVNILIDQVVP